MAMIKDHDYVVIQSWDCPYCITHNGGATIGRYPHGKTVTCRNCAMSMHPAHAVNVEYEHPELLNPQQEKIDE